MNLSPKNVEFFVLPMETRFPFQYGIASMTALPHLVVRAEIEIDGKTGVGIASEGLPPKWFTKNPNTTFEEQDLPDMLAVIRNAADLLTDNASPRTFVLIAWTGPPCSVPGFGSKVSICVMPPDM